MYHFEMPETTTPDKDHSGLKDWNVRAGNHNADLTRDEVTTLSAKQTIQQGLTERKPL